MDDLSRADGWASFILGLIVSMVGGLGVIFNLRSRVEANEKAIGVLESNHDKRLENIERQIAVVRTEVRQDIKDVGDRTEKRHDTLEDMLRVVMQRIK